MSKFKELVETIYRCTCIIIKFCDDDVTKNKFEQYKQALLYGEIVDIKDIDIFSPKMQNETKYLVQDIMLKFSINKIQSEIKEIEIPLELERLKSENFYAVITQNNPIDNDIIFRTFLYGYSFKFAGTQNPKPDTFTIEYLQNFLDERRIEVKYNDILHDAEITGVTDENNNHINENIITLIYNEMPTNLKRLTTDNISAFLDVIATRNSYNPILKRFDNIQWDKVNRLEQIYNMFQIDENDKLSRVLMEKWFMQCICGLHNNDISRPFSLDIILIFQGSQGAGKTRFFEHIALNNRYFGEGITLDTRNKDTMIESTSKWICELGEIGSTMKRDMDSVKAFITRSSDTYRKPYGRKATERPRITSFCGTVNEPEYLIDETGNRRFATIPLKPDLYIDYDKHIKHFDAVQFWCQIAEIVEKEIKENGKTYANAFRLSPEEINELNERNKCHEKPLKGEEEVTDVLAKIQMQKESGNFKVVTEYMTVTEFISLHSELRNLTAQQVGKILAKLGYSGHL